MPWIEASARRHSSSKELNEQLRKELAIGAELAWLILYLQKHPPSQCGALEQLWPFAARSHFVQREAASLDQFLAFLERVGYGLATGRLAAAQMPWLLAFFNTHFNLGGNLACRVQPQSRAGWLIAYAEGMRSVATEALMALHLIQEADIAPCVQYWATVEWRPRLEASGLAAAKQLRNLDHWLLLYPSAEEGGSSPLVAVKPSTRCCVCM